MRIAIYEPHPRVAGPVVWAQHLKQGFIALGHECDLVSVTRSGRPSKRWGPGTGQVNRGWAWSKLIPDHTVKGDDAGVFFDGYDLIILTEPKSSPFDRWALKVRGEKGVFAERHPERQDKNAEALYITWLRETSTPWTSALHGPQYQVARAPFLRDLLQLPNFTGHLMTTVDAFADTDSTGSLRACGVHEFSALPYVPTLPLDAPTPQRRAFGMLGRVVGNKGSQLLAHSVEDLPAGWNVEIHGAGAIGSGPSFTYRLYSTMKSRGFEGTLEGGDYSPAGKLRALKPEKWAVKSPESGRYVSYWGPYEDTVGTAGRFGVHVNLTESKFSYGMIEFVGLEAMDAGCLGIYPSHILGAAPYECFELKTFVSPPAIRSDHNKPGTDYLYTAGLDPRVYPELITRAREAVDLFESPAKLDVIQYNRQVIRDYHDPALLARRFLEECQ